MYLAMLTPAYRAMLSLSRSRLAKCTAASSSKVRSGLHRQYENWRHPSSQHGKDRIKADLMSAIAEDNMNVQLKDITVTARDGRVSHLDQVYIRGSHVRFFIVPDMLRYVHLSYASKAALLFIDRYISSFITTVANESSTGTHRCSEAVVLKVEVWAWREEGLRSAELEQAVEGHREVKGFSERDGQNRGTSRAASRHFRRRLGKVEEIEYETRVRA
jgi:hypothetical protein